jgi:hypothetical protein
VGKRPSVGALSIAAVFADLYILLHMIVLPPNPCLPPSPCIPTNRFPFPLPSPQLVGWLDLVVGVALLVIGGFALLRRSRAR